MDRASFPFFCKASQIGLWSIWLSGLLLISLSLYSTNHLPSLKEHITRPNFTKARFASPSVTIFSCPRPFVGPTGSRQVLAIRSWLATSPDVLVVLFGDDPSVFSFAGQLGERVSVESEIDFTFLGNPFFHSMVARSRASISEISVLIDAEAILFPEFFDTLKYVHRFNHDWLLIAKTTDISHFPFHLDDTGQRWLQEDGRKIKLKKLQEFLSQKHNWKTCGAHSLMAWNTGELPLHAGVLPPFLYGKGFHNEWVINEALSSDFRFVFDASEVVLSYYVKGLDDVTERSTVVFDNGVLKERDWEYVANSNLAALYGSLYFHQVNFTSKLVKLVRCNGKFLFINTEEKIAYDFQDLQKKRMSIWKGTISRSRTERNWNACMKPSGLVNRSTKCYIREISKLKLSKKTLVLPFSLGSLLQIVADKDKSVVLAIAGNNYRDMLMSWVCRLRHLRISNFIVCALDYEIYQFSVLQGLPVFTNKLTPGNISFNDCHFGTKCFQRVTKVKSRIVLQILKLGYNVLLSDVDVYWFMNPLPYLYSFGPSVLVAQSDEYNETVPINLPHRLNSGFYFARSDGPTITAMQKVVQHASTSDLSEQPSFYDVLCGEGGAHRIGDNKCHEPETNLTIHFLDRSRFPNGAYQGLWEKENITHACMQMGCMIIHNNWVSGRKRKLERQMSSGLWEYDASARICLKSWHNTHSGGFL